jgi:hypothetical protein
MTAIMSALTQGMIPWGKHGKSVCIAVIGVAAWFTRSVVIRNPLKSGEGVVRVAWWMELNCAMTPGSDHK